MTGKDKQTELVRLAFDLMSEGKLGAVLTTDQAAEVYRLRGVITSLKNRVHDLAHGLDEGTLANLVMVLPEESHPGAAPVLPEENANEVQPEAETNLVPSPAKKQKKSKGKGGKPKLRWTHLKKGALVKFYEEYESYSACAEDLPISSTSLRNYLKYGKVPTLETQQAIVEAITEVRARSLGS